MHLACQILRIIDRHSIVLFPTSKVKNDRWEFNLDVYWLIFNGKHVSWNLETTRCNHKLYILDLESIAERIYQIIPGKHYRDLESIKAIHFGFQWTITSIRSLQISERTCPATDWCHICKNLGRNVYENVNCRLAKSLSFSSCNCPFQIPSSNGRAELGVHMWWSQQILL